jgi:hypothetical protein
VSIPFTQFLRPNGRRTTVSIERGTEVEAMAAKLIGAGCRFEIEELMTGMVSIEAVADNTADSESPHCLALELVQNGPSVPATVDKLVKEALKTALQLGIEVSP